MAYALIIDGEPVEIHPGFGFTDANGVRHPADWAEWPPQRKAARGLRLISEPDAAPAGQRIVSTSLAMQDGALVRAATYEDLPLADLKAAKIAAAVAEYEGRLAVGFPCTLDGVAETLQCRNELDRTNWLGLKDSCNDALLAGLGDAPCPLPIRATSNAMHQLTFMEATILMRDLRAWVGAMQGVLWSLKDAIVTASGAAALEAIDVSSDWP